MGTERYSLSILAFSCGVISAKWAMELGFSQLRQVVWGVAGLLLGPLALLLLYIRLLRSRQVLRDIGGRSPYSANAGAHEMPLAGMHIDDRATVDIHRAEPIAAPNQPTEPSANARHCDWVDGDSTGAQHSSEVS